MVLADDIFGEYLRSPDSKTAARLKEPIVEQIGGGLLPRDYFPSSHTYQR